MLKRPFLFVTRFSVAVLAGCRFSSHSIIQCSSQNTPQIAPICPIEIWGIRGQPLEIAILDCDLE